MSEAEQPTIAVTIVEDDTSLRSIYADWIEKADGFRLVSQYGDGQQAYESIPQDKPDVALMDINLPGRNGVECVRELKLKLPRIQFVMITVYEDSDRIFKALEAGATGYLLKQTPRDELLASLREVYNGGSPMSSGIARKVVQCFRKPAAEAPQNELSQLSKREEEVLELLAQGYLYKEISSELELSKHTVDTYLRRIYEKLHVHSRAQATAIYTQLKPPKSALRSRG
ncbi:response regulator [Haloferula chungangensis]|uniref:Response regulator n=1 Tax=Haloferula chungangensis TaxID=1048331 RepID=A0ABW2L2D7_9BACT